MQDVLIPQWGIAVIVIGLASLMFVIIFGVTVVSEPSIFTIGLDQTVRTKIFKVFFRIMTKTLFLQISTIHNNLRLLRPTFKKKILEIFQIQMQVRLGTFEKF